MMPSCACPLSVGAAKQQVPWKLKIPPQKIQQKLARFCKYTNTEIQNQSKQANRIATQKAFAFAINITMLNEGDQMVKQFPKRGSPCILSSKKLFDAAEFKLPHHVRPKYRKIAKKATGWSLQSAKSKYCRRKDCKLCKKLKVLVSKIVNLLDSLVHENLNYYK